MFKWAKYTLIKLTQMQSINKQWPSSVMGRACQPGEANVNAARVHLFCRQNIRAAKSRIGVQSKADEDNLDSKEY
jgi:hypothetical protein